MKYESIIMLALEYNKQLYYISVGLSDCAVLMYFWKQFLANKLHFVGHCKARKISNAIRYTPFILCYI